jgi:hypothetical protein
MPAKSTKLGDAYVNRALKTVTMSAANTLTFEQIQFGVGLFQGVAMVVNRVEWHLPFATLSELVGNADVIELAITNRDDLTALTPNNQSVLAYDMIRSIAVGAVVSLEHLVMPLITDFSSLAGGGLIIPANPIYAGITTAGFAAAAQVNVIMYFTFKQLTDAEYIELLQTIMPANL